MDCQALQKKLSAFIDGEAADPDAIAEHLALCPACREALDALRGADALLAPFNDLQAPSELATRIACQAREAPPPSRAAGLWLPFIGLLPGSKNLFGALMTKKVLAFFGILIVLGSGAALVLFEADKDEAAPAAERRKPAARLPAKPGPLAEPPIDKKAVAKAPKAKPAEMAQAEAVDFEAESRKIKEALVAGTISKKEAWERWAALKKAAGIAKKKTEGAGDRRKLARAREQGYYLEPTERTVQGRLVDESGAGVADAALVIPALTGKNSEAEPAETRSDDEGRFRLTATRYRFQLRIDAPAGVEGRSLLVPHSDSAVIDLGDIALSRALSVTGRVLDPEGQPLPRARIRAFSPQAYEAYAAARNVAYIEEPGAPQEQLSDASGRFELQLSPGPRVLLASGEGLRDAAPRSIIVGPNLPALELRLQTPRRLTVIARDQLGVAVGGAAVKLTRFGQLYQGLPREPVQRSVTAEGGGRAVIDDLMEPRYQLIIEALGFARHRQNLVFEPGQGEVEISVSLQAGARVSGRLVSRDSGEGLSRGGLIFAAAGPDGRPDMQRLLAKSPIDQDGRFGYDQVPPGRYVLMVHMADHARRDISVEVPAKGGPVELGELALVPLGEVQVTVLDSEGQAAPGLSLTAGTAESAELIEAFDPTDDSGRVRLRLPRGPVTLTAQSKEGAFLAFAELDLSGTSEATLRLPAAPAQLSGRLLDSAGAALPAQRLLLRRSLAAPLLPLTTDDKGRFRIAGLPPGPYELLLSTATAAQPGFVLPSGQVIARLSLSPEQSLNRDFSLSREKD